MYSKVIKFTALVAAVMCSYAADAATIMVESTSNDPVGQSIVYSLRNQIGASSIHKLVYSKDDAGFVIEVTTLKYEDGTTVYSAALLMPPFDKKGFNYFISDLVGYCGADVTDKCAKNILSGFDGDMAQIATAFRDAMQKPK